MGTRQMKIGFLKLIARRIQLVVSGSHLRLIGKTDHQPKGLCRKKPIPRRTGRKRFEFHRGMNAFHFAGALIDDKPVIWGAVTSHRRWRTAFCHVCRELLGVDAVRFLQLLLTVE